MFGKLRHNLGLQDSRQCQWLYSLYAFHIHLCLFVLCQDFARSGTFTLETKDPRFSNMIGQRVEITFLDLFGINRLYCEGKVQCLFYTRHFI